MNKLLFPVLASNMDVKKMTDGGMLGQTWLSDVIWMVVFLITFTAILFVGRLFELKLMIIELGRTN